MMEAHPLFKKTKRVARTPKDVQAPKAKKKFALAVNQNEDLNQEVEELGGLAEKVKVPSRAKGVSTNVIIASGSLNNEESNEATVSSDMIMNVSDDSGSLKFKVTMEDTPLYKLRRQRNPAEFNEEMIFTRNLRDSFLQNQELINQRARRASRPKKVKEKHPCYGKINEIGSNSSWTYSSPAPQELVELHKKLYFENDVLEMDTGISSAKPLKRRPSGTIVDWDDFLNDPDNLQKVPSTTDFKWAPFADIWNEIAVPGISIELHNPFIPGKHESYWVGTIIHFAGYRALVQFESFDMSTSKKPRLTWISFCSDIPKPLGWCEKNGKRLIPGPVIKQSNRSLEYKRMLEEKLTEFLKRPSIVWDHKDKLLNIFRKMESAWNPALPVEVVDIYSLHQTRLARVNGFTGNFVNILYHTVDTDYPAFDYTEGHWFHYKSDKIHPLFWSTTIGVELNGVSNKYKMACGLKLPSESFPSWPEHDIRIEKGMKLEVVHPFRAWKFVGAVIIKVLQHGYFMVHTRDRQTSDRVQYVYHITCPLIFPWGFASKHNIEVDYLDAGGTRIAEGRSVLRLDLLPPPPGHNFKVGDKLEAFEAINFAIIGPVTIEKVCGHMLYLYFDDWDKDDEKNYQWVNAFSELIYPLGFCELMRFKWAGGIVDGMI